MKNTDENVKKALAAFSSVGEVKSAIPYGNGHINFTYKVSTDKANYIFQRINTYIFPNPLGIMENIKGVTDHIRAKNAEAGLDTERCAMKIVPTDSGALYYEDSEGNAWRMYEFTENTVSLDAVRTADDFRRSAEAFGRFQSLLADYPADTLCEPIKDFHNTPVRYKNFEAALAANKSGRASNAGAEIEFVKAREPFTHVLENAHARGELPLRVTHNDTKLNNILFDAESGEAICVVDLDTVSPGYSVTDFGDAIRFGANTAAEDEKDVSRVSLDLELFRAYAEGFMKGCDGRLEAAEARLLPEGAMMMTLECGMRFLTDYLDGDVYFHTAYAEHNLVRCRTQLALFADMERKKAQMDAIIKELM